MLNVKYILLIIITCFFYSCNESSRLLHITDRQIGEEKNVISIIPEKDDLKQFDFTPYLDSIKYVKLELTDESLIGTIDKLIIYNERIYILDKLTSGLFVFNIDGSFVYKIARIGQGPGEYTMIDFFDIDIENKHIVLTDLMTYWIMRYDLDGKFLFKKKIPVWCEGVSVLPNKGIVLYANFRNNSNKLAQEYNLIYLDSAMNYKQAYFPYNSKYINQKIPTSFGGQFFTYENHLNFSFPGGSVVYQITGDSLFSKYQFDFSKDMLPVENPANSEQLNEYLAKGNYNGFLTPIIENDQLLLFTMRTNIDMPLLMAYYVFCFKNSGTIVSSFFLNIENEFYMNIPLTCYKNWIVSEIQSYSLIEWKNSFKKEKLSSVHRFTKERLAIAENLSEEDNPVLMFYKLKQF